MKRAAPDLFVRVSAALVHRVHGLFPIREPAAF